MERFVWDIESEKLSTEYHPQPDGVVRCMCGEKPNEWLKWLPMAEFWYNTNYAIQTTPYEIMYGQTPPVHMPYIPGEQAIQMLKFHLRRSQDRMQAQANKQLTDSLKLMIGFT